MKWLKILLNEEIPGLIALTYQGQYYDHAQRIEDFKEFAGLTPKGEFYRDHLKVLLIFDRME